MGNTTINAEIVHRAEVIQGLSDALKDSSNTLAKGIENSSEKVSVGLVEAADRFKASFLLSTLSVVSLGVLVIAFSVGKHCRDLEEAKRQFDISIELERRKIELGESVPKKLMETRIKKPKAYFQTPQRTVFIQQSSPLSSSSSSPSDPPFTSKH
ncbi:MAG: hypothetical protein Q8P67_03795 [archaeon]|nr:hypothetical protein [archaeon]